jgi:hypothetical protein
VPPSEGRESSARDWALTSKAASTIEPIEATFIVFRICRLSAFWTGAKGGELYTTELFEPAGHAFLL